MLLQIKHGRVSRGVLMGRYSNCSALTWEKLLFCLPALNEGNNGFQTAAVVCNGSLSEGMQMPRVVRILLGLTVGYAVGVAAGVVLIGLFSGNAHDKSVEVAMTSALIAGPVGALIGVVAALMWRR